MGGDEESFTGSWRRFYKVEVSQRDGELVSFHGETVKRQRMMKRKKIITFRMNTRGNEITQRGSRTPRDSLLKSCQPAEHDDPKLHWIPQPAGSCSPGFPLRCWMMFVWRKSSTGLIKKQCQKSSLVKILLSSSHYTPLGSLSSLSIITIRGPPCAQSQSPSSLNRLLMSVGEKVARIGSLSLFFFFSNECKYSPNGNSCSMCWQQAALYQAWIICWPDRWAARHSCCMKVLVLFFYSLPNGDIFLHH